MSVSCFFFLLAVADGEPGDPRRQLRQVSIYVNDVNSIHRIDRSPHSMTSSTSGYTAAPRHGYIPPVLPSAHTAVAQREYHAPRKPFTQPLAPSAQNARSYTSITAPVAMPITISHRSQEQGLENELFLITAKPPTLEGHITNAESLVMGTSQPFQPHNIHSNVQFSVGPDNSSQQSGKIAAHSDFVEVKQMGNVETTDYDMYNRPQQPSGMPLPQEDQGEQLALSSCDKPPQTGRNSFQMNDPGIQLLQGAKLPHIGPSSRSVSFTDTTGVSARESDYHRRYSSPAKLAKNRAIELGKIRKDSFPDSSLLDIGMCAFLIENYTRVSYRWGPWDPPRNLKSNMLLTHCCFEQVLFHSLPAAKPIRTHANSKPTYASCQKPIRMYLRPPTCTV